MICDRFVDSSRAYQGGAGGLPDADVMALHRIGSGGLLPDLTLAASQLPPEVAAAKRLARRDGGGCRPHRRPRRCLSRRGRRRLRRLAEAEPERFARIDGNGAVEATHAAIMAALDGAVD